MTFFHFRRFSMTFCKIPWLFPDLEENMLFLGFPWPLDALKWHVHLQTRWGSPNWMLALLQGWPQLQGVGKHLPWHSNMSLWSPTPSTLLQCFSFNILEVGLHNLQRFCYHLLLNSPLDAKNDTGQFKCLLSWSKDSSAFCSRHTSWEMITYV